MSLAYAPVQVTDPAIARLAGLTALTDADRAALYAAKAAARRVRPQREIIAEGARIHGGSLILEGWAGRVRIFPDGRRQILSLLLPGDLIGVCRQPRPLATTTVIALTEVAVCPLPATQSPGLTEAYAISGAIEEYYLYRQLARLGRLSAYERLIDCMLELRERLMLANLVDQNSFPMPLTQEMVGDLLGLTSVHINRTLQAMRRDGTIILQNGRASLSDIRELTYLVDSRPPTISLPKH